MDLFHLFFSFRGRLNRGKYWIALFTYIVVDLITAGIGIGIGSDTLSIIMFLVVALPIFISAISVDIRRLHDMDWSGWWLLILLGLPAILNILSAAMPRGALLLNGAGYLISIGTILILGCPCGTRGPNRFGPDPIPVLVSSHPVNVMRGE